MRGMAPPGAPTVRVGRCMDGIQLNVEQGDLIGFSNHVRLLKAICRPFIDSHPAVFKEGAGEEPNGELDPDSAWDWGFRCIEGCLLVLQKVGLYGRPRVPLMNGDALAADLDDVLQFDDETVSGY